MCLLFPLVLSIKERETLKFPATIFLLALTSVFASWILTICYLKQKYLKLLCSLAVIICSFPIWNDLYPRQYSLTLICLFIDINKTSLSFFWLLSTKYIFSVVFLSLKIYIGSIWVLYLFSQNWYFSLSLGCLNHLHEMW
jgi:hypothetical protein